MRRCGQDGHAAAFVHHPPDTGEAARAHAWCFFSEPDEGATAPPGGGGGSSSAGGSSRGRPGGAFGRNAAALVAKWERDWDEFRKPGNTAPVTMETVPWLDLDVLRAWADGIAAEGARSISSERNMWVACVSSSPTGEEQDAWAHWRIGHHAHSVFRQGPSRRRRS